MTIEEMKQKKKELGYSNKTIAEKSGVPLGTVQKIFAGITESPREDTLRALSGLFAQIPVSVSGPGYSDHYSNFYSNITTEEKTAVRRQNTGRPDLLREDSAACGQKTVRTDIPWSPRAKGPYTVADYMALPDECRVELIDGYFFEMHSPSPRHQAIADWLCRKLVEFILQNKGPCYAFSAPLDVRLDKDDYTMVQPDVLVVCDRTQYGQFHGICGAPALAIEVLSPATRRKDLQLKLTKYTNAGVREYWLADPDQKLLLQYDLEGAGLPKIYNFTETVPVLIWDGKCRIDLKEMFDTISFLNL